MEINLENKDIINLFFKSNNELIDKIIIEINNRIEKVKELKEKLNCWNLIGIS